MPDAKKPPFKTQEEIWEYIEEQEATLNQLDDIFRHVKERPKAHDGIPVSPTSFKDTERLAMEDDPISQYNLSIAYKKGDAVARDLERSAQWLLKSAEAGFASAQYNLAYHFQERQDIKSAHKWYLLSANQNFGPAQFNLGNMYGNSGNYVAAYAWYYLAEQNGVDKAKENRERAATFLSSEELSRARMVVSAKMMDFQGQRPTTLVYKSIPTEVVSATNEDATVGDGALQDILAIWATKHGEADVETSQKVGYALKAQELRDYSIGLMNDDLDDSPESVAKVASALEALGEAYVIHKLPVYLYVIAAIYDGINEKEAQQGYRLFLQAEAEFIPDAVDQFWIDTFGYDMPQLVKTAKAKLL